MVAMAAKPLGTGKDVAVSVACVHACCNSSGDSVFESSNRFCVDTAEYSLRIVVMAYTNRGSFA